MEIDARVVEDKAKKGEWVTSASEVVARFSSKGVEISSGNERIRMAPSGVVLPEPIVSDGGLTVTYAAVWPGVDLRYRLSPNTVKEEIVLASPAAAVDTFTFDVKGPGLKRRDGGGVVIEGLLGAQLGFGELQVFDRNGLPVAGPERGGLIADDAVVVPGSQDKSNKLTVSLQPGWLQTIPADLYPLVIDPTVFGPYGQFEQVAWGNYGNVCSLPCAHSRVGNNPFMGANVNWRSLVRFDYTGILPSAAGWATELVDAQLGVFRFSGDSAPRDVAVRYATNYSWCGTSTTNTTVEPCPNLTQT